jgi:2-phosphoglycerate kinase
VGWCGKLNKKYVLFIGGLPGVGKSSISGYIARKFGYDIILSGDYLREFSRPLIEKSFPEMIPSVYDSWSNFGDKTPENILKGFLRQTEIMNKGSESVLKRSIKNGEKVILETLYFYPHFIETYRDNVIFIYLYISDERVHKEHLEERTQYTHPLSSGTRLSAHLYEYRIMMNYSLDFCKEKNIKTFEMSKYTEARTEIENYINGELSDGY